jgi:hypothetical protein
LEKVVRVLLESTGKKSGMAGMETALAASKIGQNHLCVKLSRE